MMPPRSHTRRTLRQPQRANRLRALSCYCLWTYEFLFGIRDFAIDESGWQQGIAQGGLYCPTVGECSPRRPVKEKSELCVSGRIRELLGARSLRSDRSFDEHNLNEQAWLVTRRPKEIAVLFFRSRGLFSTRQP